MSGYSWPIISIYFGDVLNIFLDYEKYKPKNSYSTFDLNTIKESTNSTNGTERVYETNIFLHDTIYYSGCLAGFGVGYLILCFISMSSFAVAASNQIYNIRIRFFKSILKQEMAWFDNKQSNDFASRMTA